MINIFGSIGYTLLQNTHNILIFADKHDDIPDCKNKINMAEWFKTKFNSSIILLEEVPRKDTKLKPLWELSIHTKELKDIYLNNPSIIKPVDIRNLLIPFSWETVQNTPDYNISISVYLKDIDKFLCMKNEYLINNMPLYNVDKLIFTNLGKHFLDIKDEFNQILKNLIKLNIHKQNIIYFVNNHIDILINISDLLSKIMEWYVCSFIHLYNNKPLIIHVGLAHSEEIINNLVDIYSYKIIETQGINKLNEIDNVNLTGCVQISENINNQFGGYFY